MFVLRFGLLRFSRGVLVIFRDSGGSWLSGYDLWTVLTVELSDSKLGW